MVKNSGSRIFHGSMVIPCAIVCSLTVISFGSFAGEHVKIRGKKIETSSMDYTPTGVSYARDDPHYCILFTRSSGQDSGIVGLSYGSTCSLAIWGGLTVFVACLILGIVLAAKALTGVNARSCFSVVELTVVVTTGLLDFVVAIVISAGLDKTCDAFDKSSGESLPCSYYQLNFPDNSSTEFYGNITTAEATAWIGTVILDIMAVVYFILLCSYCCHQTKTTEDEPSNPLIMSSIAENEV